MDFTSLDFLGYVALVGILYRFCPASWRAMLLLCASYLFYYTWSAEMALLLFGATTAAYFMARSMNVLKTGSKKRAALLSIVSILVMVLAVYKAAPLFGQFGKNLLMPLGISYYTFKLISYVVDVYWDKIPAEKAFVPFAAYVVFFPQIVAGPIQRSESFLSQIHNPVPPSFAMVSYGVQRILLGYFKKFLVADNLALLVNFVYGNLHDPGVPLILAFYSYPLQMYADFSGLTDIANGAACLLGIEAPENFNAPFSASSPSDYWRRWHMSLTRWLTDYVFTPLHWSTRSFGELGLVFSLFVNMILIGIWHGLRWNFVLFGALHAIYLSVDAITGRTRKKYYKAHPSAGRAMNWLGPVLTFHLIAVGFVFFRAKTTGDIFYLLGHLGQGWAGKSSIFPAFWSLSGYSVVIGVQAYLVSEVLDYLVRKNAGGLAVGAFPRWGRWAAYSCTATAVLALISILLVGGSVRNPFLYAIF